MTFEKLIEAELPTAGLNTIKQHFSGAETETSTTPTSKHVRHHSYHNKSLQHHSHHRSSSGSSQQSLMAAGAASSTPTHSRQHSRQSSTATSSASSSFAKAATSTPVTSSTSASLSLTKEELKRQQRLLRQQQHACEEPSYYAAFFTYLCFYVLNLFGKLRDTLRLWGFEKRMGACDPNPSGFAALYASFESFFLRNVYKRSSECFNRPVCSVPGAEITLVDRVSSDYNWSFQFPGTTTRCINMGSYNYLGFAENSGEPTKAALKSIEDYSSVAVCSTRVELGTMRCHQELESITAKFLGVEACLTFGMGFATNSMNIPSLVDKQCLILSDEHNHTSIVLGARLSGARIVVFKHNSPKDLESKLRRAIIDGHPVSHRPWKKILIIIEGIYSMEGSIVRLPEIIAIKKKYGAYLYIDEAHSIGAIGPHGRGVVDYWGCDPRDVDVLMGTFTKSFGSAGGYIGGSRKLINYLRHQSQAHWYASAMSAPVCWQIIRTLEIIMGLDGDLDGTRRIKQLRENCRYFRDKLVKMGFVVAGNDDSPVVPVLLYMPTKVGALNNRMLQKKIAVVTVGFPATPIVGARIRFCLSASHTREMLDKALEAMDTFGDELYIKYSKQTWPHRSFKQLKELDQQQQQQTAVADEE